MYLPTTFATALTLTILSTVFWGSWANSYKGVRDYPFALFYWDYIIGVLLCALIFAFTLGSVGVQGESFLINLVNADWINSVYALIAGVVFNVANVLLVAAIAIAGLAVAFPIAIGIAVVEGVILSYLIQPKGEVGLLAAGVAFALIAVLLNGRAYRALSAGEATKSSKSYRGIVISVISGVLMGGFAPFVARSMNAGHALTPYSVAVLFAIGALACCFVFNVYLMRRPLDGVPVTFGDYGNAGARNHLLGVVGGIAWGIGGCFNFIAAGFVGVPISYAIGQSAPMIAAAWGVFAWREFAGAPQKAWVSLAAMAICYVTAIVLIALAYQA